MTYLTKNGHKFEVEGYPRHVGSTSGHLSECLLVSLAWMAETHKKPWPLLVVDMSPYCTCDDWSPK